jgi:hypothetical protein
MKCSFILSLGFLLVLSSVAAAYDDEPPTGSIALLCKMEQHSKEMTQTITIDYDKKLANGVPATFSPSAISWTVEANSKTEHHELNRITGIYYTRIDNEPSSEPLLAFSCEKAKTKF